jgi:hypothetical protein
VAAPGRPDDRVDNLVMSFPKSGRTWLSYLYAYYSCYCVGGDRAEAFIDQEITSTAHIYRPLDHPGLLAMLDRERGRCVPRLRTGHYFPAQPYFALDLGLSKVQARSVAFLVRDPRDVVVSYFHHTTQRADHARQNEKPRLADDVDLPEVLRSETSGIRAIVAYMNQTLERAPSAFERFEIFYFEDLVANTPHVFAGFLQFFGADLDADAIRRAVERASFEKLQRLEIDRLTKKRAAPPPSDALRFRRGVPGSCRDELSASDLEYLNRVILKNLSPVFERYRQPVA